MVRWKSKKWRKRLLDFLRYLKASLFSLKKDYLKIKNTSVCTILTVVLSWRERNSRMFRINQSFCIFCFLHMILKSHETIELLQSLQLYTFDCFMNRCIYTFKKSVYHFFKRLKHFVFQEIILLVWVWCYGNCKKPFLFELLMNCFKYYSRIICFSRSIK